MTAFVIEHKNLPAVLRGKGSVLVETFDQPILYSIFIFRSATCDSLNQKTVEPDLELGFSDTVRLNSDSTVRWQYLLEDDHLIMSRSLKLWTIRNTSRFTSVEDFPGSTMVVWFPGYEKIFTLEWLEIGMKGASFEASNFRHIRGNGGRISDDPESAARVSGREFRGYCYEFPLNKNAAQ